jgi:hypothetical protein
MDREQLSRGKAAFWITGVFVITFAVFTAGLVVAKNQWSKWHWSKNNVTTTTAVGGYWGTVISSEFNEWDTGTCIDFNGGSEITGDANFYGNTGWLGLARLLNYNFGTGEIYRAEALMNRTYLDGASYDGTDDEHVTCQEIGHTIGLDHRKGPRNQTCMNDQFLGFPDFDQHDADTVAEITGGCSPAGGGGDEEEETSPEKGRKKCNDGLDNDGDGLTDGADPDCK